MEVGAVTGKDGLFEFRDVAPGGYVIATGAGSLAYLDSLDAYISPAQPDGELKASLRAPLIGRAVVHVGEQDVDNVVVPLGDGALVTGTIRMAGGDLRNLRLGRLSRWRPADGQGEEPVAAQVKPDGTFRIPRIVPDQYSVQVSGLPDGVYVKSVRLDGRDITGEDLNLASAPAACWRSCSRPTPRRYPESCAARTAKRRPVPPCRSARATTR